MSDLIFTTSGKARFLHDDDLAQALRVLGRSVTRRASHVEPYDEGRWTADMSPVGGPILGPFGCRSKALAAEREWLEEHGIPAPLEEGGIA